MNDDVRNAGLIPMSQPYSGVNGQSTTQSVLSVTGSKAVVDWIVVELRKADAPSIVTVAKPALLLRDGSIVDAGGGINDVIFDGISEGSYFVSLRHRNHLGVMTLAPLALSKIASIVDFTNMGIATYGGASARTSVGGIPCLWAGDITQDKKIMYTGSSNDRDAILARIGGIVPTNTVAGYYSEDINLNGVVAYSGSGNDRDVLTLNTGTTSVILGTVP